MKVTIFGSCRQHSIADHFQVTSIQENITFPHDTKKIIQMIEYCKGYPPNDALLLYMFRTNMIFYQPNEYVKHCMNEYNHSDVIVIEIASRTSYAWNNIYVHHVLPEDSYGFPNGADITRHVLSDQEIEEDLCRIKELILPKKLLIVSHIYTYTYGTRYELVQLLEQLCLKHNIAFLNPSECLIGEHDIYLDESILHYTKNGHSIIGSFYKDAIEKLVIHNQN